MTRAGWLGVAAGVLVAAGGGGRLRAQDVLPEAPVPATLSAEVTAADFWQQSSSATPGLQSQPQKPGAPTLDDLGLTAKADPDMQRRLDERTHDLKVHQRLGLITLAPLAAACISSAAAPPDLRNGRSNEIGRDVHVSLGSLSVAMYSLTAYYAIRAPRVGHEPAKGGIKLHKYLIYVHAPGMILTPILGAMAFNQAANGQRVTGIASAHGAVAWTTVAAYSASIVAVSWPIHLKL